VDKQAAAQYSSGRRLATANDIKDQLDPGLYVAATPIGNLKDVTLRVLECLKSADRILCEDTRQTAKLCAAYGIATPRTAYHEHNAAKVEPQILESLKAGAAICLVSDAGTPLISDPGWRLVRAARAAGVKVHPLPGPSAVVAALSASGAPTDRFLFAGFPPPRAEARARFFGRLAPVEATLVFYEGPSRLDESLRSMASALGDREAVVARELTKIHETFDAGRLQALADRYERAPPKGEIVVIVHPPEDRPPPPRETVDQFLREALERLSVKDAAAAAAEKFGLPRRDAYERALSLKETS
jgi:16S rRNA (cytidine1402-2'-O)-methyltransferase